MDNKKIPTILGTTIIIIFAITVGMLVWKYEKNQKSVMIPQQSISIEKPTVSQDTKLEKILNISDEWTRVSHDNFWGRPGIFKTSDYNFPNIEFYYPSNWYFSCCNDMNDSSTHKIRSSDDIKSYITITDYALTGCPDSENNCSIDKIIKITPDEKFRQITSSVLKEDVLPGIRLEKLKTDVFVYNNNKVSRGYVINLGDDIVEIDFNNYKLMGDAFIDDFLNRIIFEKDIAKITKLKLSSIEKWKILNDKESGITLKYPPELNLNTSRKDIIFGIYTISPMEASSIPDAQIMNQLIIYSDQRSMEEIINEKKESHIPQNFTQKKIKINGIDAEQISYRGAYAGELWIETLIKRDSDTVIISYPGDNHKNKVIFDKIISTIKF